MNAIRKGLTSLVCVLTMFATLPGPARADSSIPNCQDHVGTAACNSGLTVANGFAMVPGGGELSPVPNPATTVAPSAPMSGPPPTGAALETNTGDTTPVKSGEALPITAYVYSRCTLSCGSILLKLFVNTAWGSTLQINHDPLPHAASQEANFLLNGNVVRWWNQSSGSPYRFGYWFEATQLQAGIPVPARGPATPPLAYERAVYNKVETTVKRANGTPIAGLDWTLELADGVSRTLIASGVTNAQGRIVASLPYNAATQTAASDGGFAGYFLNAFGAADDTLYHAVQVVNANFGATAEEVMIPGAALGDGTDMVAADLCNGPLCDIHDPCDVSDGVEQIQDGRLQIGALQVPWNSKGSVKYENAAFSQGGLATRYNGPNGLITFSLGRISSNEEATVINTGLSAADLQVTHNTTPFTQTFYWDSYWEQFWERKVFYLAPYTGWEDAACFFIDNYYHEDWSPTSTVADPHPVYQPRGFQACADTGGIMSGCDEFSNGENDLGYSIVNDYRQGIVSPGLALRYSDDHVYIRKTTRSAASDDGACLLIGCAQNRSGWNTSHESTIRFGEGCGFNGWVVYATGYKGTSTGNAVNEWPFYRIDPGAPGFGVNLSGNAPEGCEYPT